MKIIFLLPFVFFFFSCKMTQKKQETIAVPENVIIYKTRNDYYQNVPVTLNREKSRLVSFPAPSDVYYQGELALPIELKDGYLLDRMGIGPNSAFTSYSYQKYADLDNPPPIDEIYDSLIDEDPFLEIYDCGNKKNEENLIGVLNKMIDEEFKDCERIK